jgi:hypothetical protein
MAAPRRQATNHIVGLFTILLDQAEELRQSALITRQRLLDQGHETADSKRPE